MHATTLGRAVTVQARVSQLLLTKQVVQRQLLQALPVLARQARQTYAGSSPAFGGQWPPLAEQSACASVPLPSLLEFRAWAVALAAEVGGSIVEAPTRDDLTRELGWLLEDAVAAPPWATLRWSPPPLAAAATPQGPPQPPVALRCPLPRLKDLWRLRVHHRVPLQYLTGTAHWRDLVLAVGPGALVPRPETSALVDLALQAANEQPELGSGVWVDAGTGSGAIAVALAQGLPRNTQVAAVDASGDALVWARRNFERLCGGDRHVQVYQGDWLEALPPSLRGALAAVVSNPPYIPDADVPTLQAEVALHEPHEALKGGAGLGLGPLTQLCRQARAWLRPGGLLALETNGKAQVQELCAQLGGSGGAWEAVRGHADQFGVLRFVTATRGTA